MIDQTNYLDAGNLIFNELIGDVMLALFVGYIIIGIMGVNSKLPWQLLLLNCLLWTMLVFAFNTGLLILWVASVGIAGVSFYFTLSKLINRGG